MANERSVDWKTDRLTRVVGATFVAFAVLTLAGLLTFRQVGPLVVLPWFIPTTQAFVDLASLAIAALCFGRHRTFGRPWDFWTGLAFLANSVVGVFYLLAWPDLLGSGQGVIARLSNTASWLRILTYLSLALLPAGAIARRPRRLTTRNLALAYTLAGGLSLLVSLLSVLFEAGLPAMAVDGVFTALTAGLLVLLALAYLGGAAAMWRRYLRAGDHLLAYLALFLLLMVFTVLYALIGGARYTPWWYASRFLYVPAHLVVLFGLLQEGYALFARERLRAENLAALNELARSLGGPAEIGETGQTYDLLRRSNEQLAVAAVRTRELAEEAQRRAGELEAVIENMAEGVAIVDGAGRVVRLNRVQREWLALPDAKSAPLELAQFPAAYAYHVDGRPFPVGEWPLSRVLRGEPFAEAEMVLRRPGKEDSTLVMRASAVRDEAGEVLLAVAIWHDITAIRALERQREEFISVVAHDLRGALTPIRGHVDLLARRAQREGPNQPLQRSLATIASSSRRLERMIADLLDVSRIEARRLALSKETIDLGAFVSEVVERAEELTKDHAITVAVRGAVPPVAADPDRVEQVLSNLLSNAAKYSYPASPVTVEVAPGPGEVIVAVTNRGPGVPAAERERLFTRFHRIQRAAGGRVPGLGLGLYIARGLVEAHGGRIWVESEPDQDTTFRFTLPA